MQRQEVCEYLKMTRCFVSSTARWGREQRYSEPPIRVPPMNMLVRSRLGENLRNKNKLA